MSSRKQSPIDEFVCHGIKVIGAYTYFLLVDATGKCYIEQVANDDTSFKFVKMAELPISTSFNDIATAIDSFWAAPETYTYKYLFQL